MPSKIDMTLINKISLSQTKFLLRTKSLLSGLSKAVN